MRALDGQRRFRMETRYPHQRSEGLRGTRGTAVSTCRVRGCDRPATATVLVGAIRCAYCFDHEREYADRYGPADVYAIRRAE